MDWYVYFTPCHRGTTIVSTATGLQHPSTRTTRTATIRRIGRGRYHGVEQDLPSRPRRQRPVVVRRRRVASIVALTTATNMVRTKEDRSGWVAVQPEFLSEHGGRPPIKPAKSAYQFFQKENGSSIHRELSSSGAPCNVGALGREVSS
jgi:hypothetical protein